MGQLGFSNERFCEVRYYEHGAEGSGKAEDNAAPIETSDLVDLPAGCVVEKAYVIVDEAVTGATGVEVGDADDPDGFITSAVSDVANPGGPKGLALTGRGAYLADGTGKYYDAATADKKVSQTVAGTSTAGKYKVVLEGFYLGR